MSLKLRRGRAIVSGFNAGRHRTTTQHQIALRPHDSKDHQQQTCQRSTCRSPTSKRLGTILQGLILSSHLQRKMESPVVEKTIINPLRAQLWQKSGAWNRAWTYTAFTIRLSNISVCQFHYPCTGYDGSQQRANSARQKVQSFIKARLVTMIKVG